MSRVVKPVLSRRPGSDPRLWNTAGDVGSDPGVTISRVCQMGWKQEKPNSDRLKKMGQLIELKTK